MGKKEINFTRVYFVLPQMRDKQSPDDTYNYKEHVYADPLALRQEIKREKLQEAEKTQESGREKARYQPSSCPQWAQEVQ